MTVSCLAVFMIWQKYDYVDKNYEKCLTDFLSANRRVNTFDGSTTMCTIVINIHLLDLLMRTREQLKVQNFPEKEYSCIYEQVCEPSFARKLLIWYLKEIRMDDPVDENPNGDIIPTHELIEMYLMCKAMDNEINLFNHVLEIFKGSPAPNELTKYCFAKFIVEKELLRSVTLKIPPVPATDEPIDFFCNYYSVGYRKKLVTEMLIKFTLSAETTKEDKACFIQQHEGFSLIDKLTALTFAGQIKLTDEEKKTELDDYLNIYYIVHARLFAICGMHAREQMHNNRVEIMYSKEFFIQP